MYNHKPLGFVAFHTSCLAALMALSADRSLVLYSALKESFCKNKVTISAHVEKANQFLKGVTFKKFDSDSICTAQLDLSKESYDSVIQGVINSYNFKQHHLLQLKNLFLGADNVTQIRNICAGEKNGSVIYGKFAVVKQPQDLVDLAYAVYTAKYEFNPITAFATKLDDNSWDYTYTTEYPRIPATEGDLLPFFFENRAIESLELRC